MFVQLYLHLRAAPKSAGGENDGHLDRGEYALETKGRGSPFLTWGRRWTRGGDKVGLRLNDISHDQPGVTQFLPIWRLHFCERSSIDAKLFYIRPSAEVLLIFTLNVIQKTIPVIFPDKIQRKDVPTLLQFNHFANHNHAVWYKSRC